MKRVRFDEGKNKVYTIVAWNYAYKQARDNFYERLAWDRAHFQRRIHHFSTIVKNVFTVEHRNKIYCERFLSYDMK
jgi:hypothetical protein